MENANFTNTMPKFAGRDAPMTFGIELECIAVYPVGLMAPAGEPGDAINTLSRGMMEKGINSTGHENLDDDISINGGEQYSQWVVQSEAGLYISPKELQTLLKHSNGVNYHIQPLEVSSRILGFDSNWQEEIQMVLSVFQDLRDRGASFLTNATTGFHVHIGFGDQRVPLRTAKSVLEFCAAFEDRLDALYSTNRIDGKCAENVQQGRHFNAGLAWHFQHNPKTDFGPNIFHWLMSIEEAESFEELGNFFVNALPGENHCRYEQTDAHFSTLNLDNLYKSPLGEYDDGAPSGTIEFRQHQGTLNAEAIFSQVLLTQSIVSWCHLAPDAEFLQVFANIANPKFRLTDLLQYIGCRKELIEYHQERRTYLTQKFKEDEYNGTVEDLKNGEFQGAMALEAQAFIEDYERTNWKAVSSVIASRFASSAYAENETRQLDILNTWGEFWWWNARYWSAETIDNLSRTMIFQQLNGDDVWTDLPEDMILT